MQYDTPGLRAAYLAGATYAAEATMLDLSAAKAREMEDWLAELGAWTKGPPPLGPQSWGLEADEG